MASKKEVDLKLALDTKTIKASVNRASSSFENLSKNIKRSVFRASRQLDGLTSSFRNIGLAAGVAAAGGLYTFNSALKETVSFANDQEAAEIKLAGVLRATGEAAGHSLQNLKKYASELQGITTVGDEVTLAGMSILATFKEIKGDQFKEATKAAIDMSAVMGTDLKSSILQVGKALNDPAKGMSALSRAGVSFTEAQKDQVKALQKSGDMIGAQKIILAELKGEFGAVANAMKGTFKGAVTTLSNSFGDLKEEIGFAVTKNQFFLEGAKVIDEQFASWTTSIQENRGEWMQWSKQSSLSVMEFAADFAEGIDSTYKALNRMNAILNLSWAGTVLLGKGFQFAFEHANRFAGDTKKAEYWAKAQTESAAVVEEAMKRASEALDNADNGLPMMEKTAAKIRELKEELKKIGAVEVDPAATLLKSTEKTKRELVKIGDTWVNVNKKKVEETKKTTDQEINELDRFKDADGKTWREVKEDAEKSIMAILAELQKVRKEVEKPYVMNFVKDGATSGGGGGGGYATGGKVFGPGGIDKVPAWLTAGEFVIKKQAVDKFGYGIFHALNNMQMPRLPRFAAGGPVVAGAVSVESSNQPVTINLYDNPGGEKVTLTAPTKFDFEGFKRVLRRRARLAS